MNNANQQHKSNLIKVLVKFVPELASPLCADLIMQYNLHLHIEAARKSKYGDYAPHLGKGNRITVNHNLSKFDFLITFIHEVAHHITYLKYGPRHNAHGAEWKQEFKLCMQPFLMADIFPYDLKAAIAKHMQNPKYSHAADLNLLKVLRKYDDKTPDKLVLDNLKQGSLFKLKDSSVVMEKQHKLRTYYYCIDIISKKAYRVHAMAEVEQVGI
jgi:hypothetical protein